MNPDKFNAESPATPTRQDAEQRSLRRFLVACGLGVVTVTLVVGTRGRLSQLFVEFDLPLSRLTSISLSLVPPGMLTLVVAITVVFEVIKLSAAARNAWNAAAIIASLAVLALYGLGVALSLIQLLNALS